MPLHASIPRLPKRLCLNLFDFELAFVLWANVRDSRGPRLALLENATRRTLALRNPKTHAWVRVLTGGRQAPAIQSEALFLLPGTFFFSEIAAYHCR